MFSFFKYDETGYTDFGNSIFSNLDSSQFDITNDKVTIEDIDYRISTIRELCDNCNNSETYLNETMTTRPTHRIITTPGAKGTIPATNDHTDGSWLPTDLYNGEVLINTSDNIAYIRSGNEIRSWQLNPIDINPPVAFEFIEPESLTVGNPPHEVMFYGSGLDRITGIDYNAIEYGVTVSGFEVLSQEQISLIIDTSQANIGGSSGVTLEIPFIIESDTNLIKASLSLLANSIPQGDPVITNIEPFGNNVFVAGQQTVKISGIDLTGREGLSINPENDMITQLSYEFDADNNILAQMDIPAELLDTMQSFVLSYDGYLSEPFQVNLRSQEILPPVVPEIISITDIYTNPVSTETTNVVINGADFTEQSTVSIAETVTGEQIPYGNLTRTDTTIIVAGVDLSSFGGSSLIFIVSNGETPSNEFTLSI